MLNGFATPSRIFGLAFKQKKIAKKIWYILEICFKVKKVFEITLFYGNSEGSSCAILFAT
jgi:hypothetical protein